MDATYVYWADSDSVKRVPIAGGIATPLVSNISSPGLMSVDSTNLYYIDVSGALFRLPLGGTIPTRLMDSGQALTYVAFGPTTFYWSNGTTINSIPLTGGAVGTASASPVKLLYTAPAEHRVRGLSVRANSLYWVDFPTQTTSQYFMKLTPN